VYKLLLGNKNILILIKTKNEGCLDKNIGSQMRIFKLIHSAYKVHVDSGYLGDVWALPGDVMALWLRPLAHWYGTRNRMQCQNLASKCELLNTCNFLEYSSNILAYPYTVAILGHIMHF
jgi:hypothetical protein